MRQNLKPPIINIYLQTSTLILYNLHFINIYTCLNSPLPAYDNNYTCLNFPLPQYYSDYTCLNCSLSFLKIAPTIMLLSIPKGLKSSLSDSNILSIGFAIIGFTFAITGVKIINLLK